MYNNVIVNFNVNVNVYVNVIVLLFRKFLRECMYMEEDGQVKSTPNTIEIYYLPICILRKNTFVCIQYVYNREVIKSNEWRGGPNVGSINS